MISPQMPVHELAVWDVLKIAEETEELKMVIDERDHDLDTRSMPSTRHSRRIEDFLTFIYSVQFRTRNAWSRVCWTKFMSCCISCRRCSRAVIKEARDGLYSRVEIHESGWSRKVVSRAVVVPKNLVRSREGSMLRQ